jgi:cystathionine beta-lyase/cystathionine gamma-synthase
MKKGTGQFSIALKAKDVRSIEKFCEKLKHFFLAVSWGSYESLVFPACTFVSAETNYKIGDLKWNWVRFSIGFEEAETLIEDLKQALEEI